MIADASFEYEQRWKVILSFIAELWFARSDWQWYHFGILRHIVFWSPKRNSSYFSNSRFKVEQDETDQLIRAHIWPKSLYSSGTVQISSALQANFDVGIPILGTSILGFQIKNEESTYKGVSKILSFCQANPIMGNLHRVVGYRASALNLLFGGLKATPDPQYQRKQIDLSGYHLPNYFARLVPKQVYFKGLQKKLIISIRILLLYYSQ